MLSFSVLVRPHAFDLTAQELEREVRRAQAEDRRDARVLFVARMFVAEVVIFRRQQDTGEDADLELMWLRFEAIAVVFGRCRVGAPFGARAARPERDGTRRFGGRSRRRGLGRRARRRFGRLRQNERRKQ